MAGSLQCVGGLRRHVVLVVLGEHLGGAKDAIGTDGVFKASEVLAKHDENYMPPEAAEALKKAGHPMDKGAFAGQKGGK